MTRYRVRFTPDAEDDLLRLYDFLLEKDLAAAERALQAIRDGIEVLRLSPFACRKAVPDNPLLRELVIPFGSAGYVALFEIEGPSTVTILAVRHQREDDYH
jgi:plasmid stabilization system protein ParE